MDRPVAANHKPPPVEPDLPDLSMADQTVAMSPPPGNDVDEFRQQAEVSFGSTNPVPLQISAAAALPGGVGAPLPDVSFGAMEPHALTTSQAPLNTPDAPDSGMLEFDLGTLSLDLDPAPNGTMPAALGEPEDPMATKLALAEEFVSIGDDDGARALIEEVIAEATGELKTKAQRALSSLG